MRKLVVLVVSLSLGSLTACGGGDGATDPIGNLPCDPLANTGCADGEKCSILVEAIEPAIMSRTACVPDGAVAVGDACTSAFANPGQLADGQGFDDCAGGGLCLNGLCTEICQLEIAADPADDIDTCPAGQKVCGLFSGIFQDAESIDLGGCAPLCDLFDAESCGEREACYLSLVNGAATCSTNTVGGAIGQTCSGLNSCGEGLGCVLENASDQLLCTPYCKADDGTTVSGADCSILLGPQATDVRCLQINSFYNNVQRVDDSLGMCVDCGDSEFSGREACAPAAQ